MPKVKIVEASPEQKAAREKGAKYASTPRFRLRCQAILLQCEKRTARAVAKELGCCDMSVNNGMVRFAEHGMEGLKGAKGRARKGIRQKHRDLEAVHNRRQRIRLAKAEREDALGKTFSQLTLRRFQLPRQTR